MGAPEHSHLEWTKARASAGVAACVEFAQDGDMIALRDSKNPGIVLHYTRREIDAFLDGAKNGEFDHFGILPV